MDKTQFSKLLADGAALPASVSWRPLEIRQRTLFSSRWLRLAVKLFLVQKRLRVFGSRSRLRGRGNSVHRAEHHQLRGTLLRILAAEKITQNRNISQARQLAVLIGDPVVHQTGNDETLAILDLKLSLRTPRAQRGHGEPGDGQRIGEVQLADLRHHLQMDIAVRHDQRRELQLHAEFAKLNGHRGKSLPGLNNRKGKFAAGEKTGFFSVHGNQIGLGQNLEKILLL